MYVYHIQHSALHPINPKPYTLNPKSSISTSITSNWILHLGLIECSDFQQVCQKAWEVIYNVSHEKTIQLSREVKLGDVTGLKRSIQEKFTTTKFETVDNWMNLYFEKVADHMPDKNSAHLPAWMTQAWLHGKFLKSIKIMPGGKFF